MICPTFSPRRLAVLLALVALTVWHLGSLNAAPHGADRVRQSRPFPTLPVNR